MNLSPISQRPFCICRRFLVRSIAYALAAATVASVNAHQGAPPISLQRQVLPISKVRQLLLPATDAAAELATDARSGRRVPLRYAVSRPVRITPQTGGTWEQLPEGRLWRVRIFSPGATDLNLGFSVFWLPTGATLHLLSEGEQFYQGPYTAADNQGAGQLWTPVVPGDAAVVELFVPEQAAGQPRLELTHVGSGYRDLFGRRKDGSVPKAETCEIDVVCPVAAAWADEIRSVARISIGGTEFCSGTLIMDAPGDFRAFFLTANHCGIDAGNASTVVVYWNYQSPTCGQHGSGASTTNTQSGATFRASKSDVDFCLIELNQLPPASYNVYYAGWDRSGTAPGGGVGIHHPNSDGKCISFSSNPLTTVNSCIGVGANTHWRVYWTSGVTEPGSSGSGFWDGATHLVVGTLSGGGSDCSSPGSPDCYGKFSVAWASGTSAATRLRDWLDPQGSGVYSVAGAYNPAPVLLPAGIALTAEDCSPGNSAVDPGELVTVNLSLQNAGSVPTTNLVATLLATNGVLFPSPAQTYWALSAGGAAVARAFTFVASGTCGGSIAPTLQFQDGDKNLGRAAFTTTLGAVNTSFAQSFDTVSAPALPPAWASSPTSTWVTTADQRDSLPNAAFAPDPGNISDEQLTSPSIPVTTTTAQLTFRHYYDTESGYDGGVLELAINTGAFVDILSAGGSFDAGGYNDTIFSYADSPLAGRSAWSGSSGGFVTSRVRLPAVAAGNNIRLRWRLGSDSSTSATGWYVDSILITDGSTCCVGIPHPVLTGQANPVNHQFQITLTGGTGYSYAILASSNLSSWSPLKTNTSPFSFIDSNAPGFPRRYYRARYQP